MLSVSHLIIIFLVALIVFGPEKLPDLARNLSKVMREFNRATGGLRESIERDLRQLEREVIEQRSLTAAPAPAALATPTPAPAPVVTEEEPEEPGVPAGVPSAAAATDTASAASADVADASAPGKQPSPSDLPSENPANGHGAGS
jgi:sec-independent protein translocase protein TatB